MNTNNLVQSVGYGPWCYRSMLNDTTATGLYSTDYLGIANGIVTSGTSYIQAYHVCGTFDGLQADFGDVYGMESGCRFTFICLSVLFNAATFSGPAHIQFRSDDTLRRNGAQGLPQTSLEAQELAAAGFENGFKLTYSFTSVCPQIVV